MTRLASAAKAGYFPISSAVTDRIAAHLSAPDGGRVYDPCCGKGTALVHLAAALHLEPFGNELDGDRAGAARAAMGMHLATRNSTQLQRCDRQVTRIFHAPMQQMQVKPGAFGLLYFNPPYDFDDTHGGRLELTLLKAVRPALCADGVLVAVIPQRVPAYREVAQYLASHFRDLRVYAHPAAHRKFGEVTVLGIHNRRAAVPEAAVVAHLRGMGSGEILVEEIAEQVADEAVYAIPKSSVATGDLVFRSVTVSAEEVAAEAAQHGVLQSAEWRQHVHPNMTKQTAFRPLTPLRRGHLVNLIAAGMLNNTVLTHHTDGRQLFIKGQTYKAHKVRIHREYDPDEEGGYTEVTTDTEQFTTSIATLSPDGTLERREGAKLEGFLRQWIQPLTDAVVEQYNPVYRFDTNGYAPVLDRLNQQREIPNTNGMRGLLPAQQHAVAAVATRLDPRHLNARDVILRGMMGVGKTAMGPAVAACIRAARVLVMCPPHLTAKWEREIRHVIPDVRVLQLKKISDVDAFFEMEASAEQPVYGVMKETTARSASGWEHAYTWCGSIAHKPLQKKKKTPVRYGSAIVQAVEEARWEDDAETVTFTIAGREHTYPLKTLLKYTRQFRVPQSPDSGRPLVSGDVPLSIFGRKRTTWHNKGERYEALYHYTRRFPKGKRGLSMREALTRQTKIQRNLRAGYGAYDPFAPSPVKQLQGSPGYAKWPLATYILKRYRNRIDCLLVDEAHEMKAKDSDRGYAFGRLVAASRKVIGLTGTIYGGRASTLFSLLYRMSRRMKQVYKHTDVARWSEEYGILQEVQRVRFDASGTQTGNTRSNVTVKELPGASPAMMRWLLDRTVFVDLEDLGFVLPDYKEEPVLLEMSPEMKVQYDLLEAQLKNEMKMMLVRGDRSLLAAYLQALLCWPDSPWRSKGVEHPHTGQRIAYIPGLPEQPVGAAPKEAALLKKIQAEIAAGRNVLLLCQQTMTLDITPQWGELLESHGIKTAVLTVEPARRETWIEKQAERGTQVIISHPRRVQTGLDLLEFPTILWQSIDYSVYTVKQASRRSYRIGQTEDVLVQFYAYRGTLQETALRLVAAKMVAADRIDGNTVSTDGLSELDEIVQGDLITTLARIVVGEEELAAPSLSEAFDTANAELKANLAYIGAEVPATTLPTQEPARLPINGYGDVAIPMERLLVKPVGHNGNGHDDADLIHEETAPAIPPAAPAQSLWEMLRGA